jgi:hypothetical protein
VAGKAISKTAHPSKTSAQQQTILRMIISSLQE